MSRSAFDHHTVPPPKPFKSKHDIHVERAIRALNGNRECYEAAEILVQLLEMSPINLNEQMTNLREAALEIVYRA